MKKNYLFLISIILLAAVGCGGRSFTKSPVDKMILDFDKDSTFSIILYDMDADGMFFKNYLHKYKIVREFNGQVKTNTTDWIEVSKDFFYRHENDLGMEIAAKSKDGKISKVAAPPGYSSYVGNSRYGQWNNSGGSSFWVFYGQYAMMRTIFGMGSYPVYRDSYRNYDNRYRGQRPYYGKTGKEYGTRSTFNQKTNPRSSWNQKVQRRASRYNSKSSMRSRSRGFGK